MLGRRFAGASKFTISVAKAVLFVLSALSSVVPLTEGRTANWRLDHAALEFVVMGRDETAPCTVWQRFWM